MDGRFGSPMLALLVCVAALGLAPIASNTSAAAAANQSLELLVGLGQGDGASLSRPPRTAVIIDTGRRGIAESVVRHLLEQSVTLLQAVVTVHSDALERLVNIISALHPNERSVAGQTETEDAWLVHDCYASLYSLSGAWWRETCGQWME